MGAVRTFISEIRGHADVAVAPRTTTIKITRGDFARGKPFRGTTGDRLLIGFPTVCFGLVNSVAESCKRREE